MVDPRLDAYENFSGSLEGTMRVHTIGLQAIVNPFLTDVQHEEDGVRLTFRDGERDGRPSVGTALLSDSNGTTAYGVSVASSSEILAPIREYLERSAAGPYRRTTTSAKDPHGFADS